MGVRVGIDLVSVASIQASIDAHGDRYLDRLYTARELSDCRSAGEIDPERLAARFAAKEATMKVLRPADQAIPWNTIEIRRDPAGWVDLELTGRAAALATEAGVRDLAVSLTHEGSYASAVVVAELSSSPPDPEPMRRT